LKRKHLKMRRVSVLIVSVYPYQIQDRTRRTDRLPLGPLYAFAAARRAGPFGIAFLDLATVTPEFRFEDKLQEIQPDLVALGIHSTIVLPLAHKLAHQVKLWNPNTVVLAGGVFASSCPRICLGGEGIDYVLQGEVDESLFLLINCMQQERELAVPGLITKNPDGNGILHIAPPSYPDLNKLPRIPQEGFDVSAYSLIDPLISTSDKTLNISSGRGCPHSCAYCCYSVVGNRRRRLRAPILLAEDLRSLAAEYGIRQFNFVDDSFLCAIERTKVFCERILDSGFLWRCQSRTDDFKRSSLSDIVRLLRKSGCRLVSFGIESGDPEVLKRVNKPLDLEWAKLVCHTLMTAGISVRVYVMLGLPYQTLESVEKTKRFLREVDPSSVSVEVFVPHPGSLIGDRPQDWGITWQKDSMEARIQRLDWLFDSPNVKVEPCINTNWMSMQEIVASRDDLLREWPSLPTLALGKDPATGR
jgi:anaerobic magnesium-protoporphyrin IX monomethyl ester cyclase